MFMVGEVDPPATGGTLFHVEASRIETPTGTIQTLTVTNSITGATMLKLLSFIRAALIWLRYIDTPPIPMRWVQFVDMPSIRIDSILPLRI